MTDIIEKLKNGKSFEIVSSGTDLMEGKYSEELIVEILSFHKKETKDELAVVFFVKK